ncbi:unnamed protein product [Rhizopus stolonifer]
MSKMLLSNPEIMCITVHSLIDVDVSPDSYSVVSTEWADGSHSDMVYVSTKLPPPILIEVQYQVNQEFMLKLINYASNVYKRYKALPIVLVIVTKSFSSAEFQNEFTVSAERQLSTPKKGFSQLNRFKRISKTVTEVKEKAMIQDSIPLKKLHLLKLSASLEREKNGEKFLIKVKQMACSSHTNHLLPSKVPIITFKKETRDQMGDLFKNKVLLLSPFVCFSFTG